MADTLVCRLDGRSTLARLGIIVQCTSTAIDSINTEYRSIVLEIANISNSTIVIPNRHPIGMVTFEMISTPVSKLTIQKQYSEQNKVEPPNLNFKVEDYGL